MTIIWTDYMKYRVQLRRFDLSQIESIIRLSEERYLDTTTGRNVVVGRHGKMLVMIPYDREDDTVTPVTIHATSRQQINFRVKSGRLNHEKDTDAIL